MQNETAIEMVNSIKNDVASLIAENSELRECLREAVSEMCAAYCEENGLNCRKEQGECFVQKWINVLAKAAKESEVRNA